METPQKIYGIGIVGCGNISDTHAEAILETTQGDLVAAHSRTKSTVDTFCEKYNIQGFTSYEEFLTNPDLDIVVICTPSGTHLDYGKLAAQAGKHVIVEKPIEVTVARGYSLIESCKQNNVNLGVIYQNRFVDDIIRMKKIIENQEIGEIFMASASVKWFREQKYYSESSWRGTYALDGGGVVINQSIHTIDLLQWLMEEVALISAFKGTFTHQDMEAEDNAVASFKFKNGAIGVFEASTSVTPPQSRIIEINGSGGTLKLVDDILYKYPESDNKDPQVTGAKSATGAADPLAGMTARHHKKQYDQMLDAFRNNTEPVVSGEESLHSLAIVEALYRSADQGEPVYIEEIFSKAKSG